MGNKVEFEYWKLLYIYVFILSDTQFISLFFYYTMTYKYIA